MNEFISGWDKTTLKNIVKRDISYGVLKPGENQPNGIPMIRINNIDKSHRFNANDIYFISQQLSDEYKRTQLEGGEILISVVGTVGRLMIVPEYMKGANISRALAVIELDTNVVNTKYLYYFLQSDKVTQTINREMQGNAQKVLNLGVLRSLEVVLPNKEIQYKIANILSSVDEAIEKTEAIIEKTEGVKKGLMQQLLTKGIGHTKFKVTEFGEIPEEWEVVSFNGVLSFVGSGITPKGGSSVYQLEGIPFIRSQNVYPDGLRLDDIAFLSDAIHEKMSRSKVQEHDVLLNITGASIGRCTYVPTGFGEANVNQHVCILRSNGKVHYKYLAYFMSSSLGQKQIFSEQAGQTREGLNYQQIRSFSIVIPSMKEQEKIAHVIEIFNQKVNNEKTRLRGLQNLKKALMQSLFTGKVRLKVGETEVTQV